MNKKKTVVICGICCLLIIGAICAFGLLGGSEKTETVMPQMGNLEKSVSETGTVAFDDEYSITALVSAKVVSADFQEGDAVAKDDVLYILDDVELKNQIEQTRVSLEQAREAYSQSVSAKNDLTLYAKASGMVTDVYVHEGDYVQPGTPVAEIVESEYMKLTIPFSLPENLSVYNGMKVKVVMTVNGAEVDGSVDKVYESEQSFEGGRRGKNIEIKIKNPGALKAGDGAFAEISGISSISSGVLENYTQQTVVASQAGEIADLPIRRGTRVNVGAKVMQVKNDSISNAVNNSALAVKEIETVLSQMEEKLDDYTVKSPIDGVVITKTAKIGDIASGGAPLAVVADVSKLYVNADIDELFIKDVAVGQAAVVTTQNGEMTEYFGKVRRINDSGVEKNGVTYYEVQIELDNTEGLIEGMNMDVTIVTERKENVLYLPRECVNGNKVTVFKNGKKVEKTVQTGLDDGKYIEIKGGIDLEDKVVKGSGK